LPVPVMEKLKAVVDDLGSQARALGVSPSRVSRWLRQGEEPDPENRRKLEGLEFVIARARSFMTPETLIAWLSGSEPFLNNFAPIDMLARGRVTDVLAALDGFQAGSFS
jgi:transcriptional regulator with XRE-family HTH domain